MGVVTTTLEKAVNWAPHQRHVADAVWPGLLRHGNDGRRRPDYDMSRFGMELMRACRANRT